MNECSVVTKIGNLRIRDNGRAVTGITFDGEGESGHMSDLARLVVAEIEEYLAGRRRVFTVPYELPDTPVFWRAVWDALGKIKYGEVKTYGEIAREIGSPKGARAVGQGCHNNPISVIVPCHRVVGSDGSVTGYAGGVEVKKLLLRIEQNP